MYRGSRTYLNTYRNFLCVLRLKSLEMLEKKKKKTSEERNRHLLTIELAEAVKTFTISS